MKKLLIISCLLASVAALADTNVVVNLSQDQVKTVAAEAAKSGLTPEQHLQKRVAQEIKKAEDADFFRKFTKASEAKRKQVMEILDQP